MGCGPIYFFFADFSTTAVRGFFTAVLFFTYRPEIAERPRPPHELLSANRITSFAGRTERVCASLYRHRKVT